MQNKLFNSTYENSLRILLLLSLIDKGTADKLVALDFITIYGSEFGISELNLHGENEFSFGEFALRRQKMPEIIKELVLDGTIKVSSSEDGFIYSISSDGRIFCNRLKTEYSKEYKSLAKKAIAKFGNVSEITLIDLITKKSIVQLRG